MWHPGVVLYRRTQVRGESTVPLHRSLSPVEQAALHHEGNFPPPAPPHRFANFDHVTLQCLQSDRIFDARDSADLGSVNKVHQYNLYSSGEAAGASSAVHSISPTSISEGGGVIFIYGNGFSADNFNFNDPILGNKIWFYNDFETIPCASPVKKNWLLQNPQAPSTTTVVCSLPARQSKEGSTRYQKNRKYFEN